MIRGIRWTILGISLLWQWPMPLCAQLPPRGITPTPRATARPTSTPAPQPTIPAATPVQTPTPQRTQSTVASTRWRITAEVWDEGNKMWAPEGVYEVTGGEGCYLFLEQPCAVRVEKAR